MVLSRFRCGKMYRRYATTDGPDRRLEKMDEGSGRDTRHHAFVKTQKTAFRWMQLNLDCEEYSANAKNHLLEDKSTNWSPVIGESEESGMWSVVNTCFVST